MATDQDSRLSWNETKGSWQEPSRVSNVRFVGDEEPEPIYIEDRKPEDESAEGVSFLLYRITVSNLSKILKLYMCMYACMNTHTHTLVCSVFKLTLVKANSTQYTKGGSLR